MKIFVFVCVIGLGSVVSNLKHKNHVKQDLCRDFLNIAEELLNIAKELLNIAEELRNSLIVILLLGKMPHLGSKIFLYCHLILFMNNQYYLNKRNDNNDNSNHSNDNYYNKH